MATYFTMCPNCGDEDECDILKTNMFPDIFWANDTWQLSCPNCRQHFALSREDRNNARSD